MHRLVGVTATAAILLATVLAGCGKTAAKGDAGDTFLSTKVVRGPMNMKVSATGTLQPIQEIEIKSKASGKILRLPVETGQIVQPGELLVQVDTTDVAATLREDEAQVEYQRAVCAHSRRVKMRDDTLFTRGMLSSDDHDNAVLDYAHQNLLLVQYEATLSRAQVAMDETVVRAPSRGTILERDVALGQVIASGTSGFSEGTVLMKMADLTTMQVKVLVDEADIGKVEPGQTADVKVDAFPDRPYRAVVDKIDPKSVDQQNVTFFPVLVNIPNPDGKLLPGMKASVDIEIIHKDSVLTVGSDALVPLSDAPATGKLIGVPEDTVNAVLKRAGLSSRPMPFAPYRPGMAPPPMPSITNAVAFVPDSNGLNAVVVKLGIRDWRSTEVDSGLAAGTTVIVPPSATIAQQFAQYREMAAKYSSILGRK